MTPKMHRAIYHKYCCIAQDQDTIHTIFEESGLIEEAISRTKGNAKGTLLKKPDGAKPQKRDRGNNDRGQASNAPNGKRWEQTPKAPSRFSDLTEHWECAGLALKGEDQSEIDDHKQKTIAFGAEPTVTGSATAPPAKPSRRRPRRTPGDGNHLRARKESATKRKAPALKRSNTAPPHVARTSDFFCTDRSHAGASQTGLRSHTLGFF